MNKFEQYIEGKTYTTKTKMVKDCFLHFKEITIRDMLISPFWINCPYSVMKSLRDHHDINFTKEDLIKKGKKVCEVYKLA